MSARTYVTISKNILLYNSLVLFVGLPYLGDWVVFGQKQGEHVPNEGHNEMEDMRYDKDEMVVQMREDNMLKNYPDPQISDLRAIPMRSDNITSEVVELLTVMVRQLGASQDAIIRGIRAEYDAKIESLMCIIEKISDGRQARPC